jgi:hypothetical protein
MSQDKKLAPIEYGPESDDDVETGGADPRNSVGNAFSVPVIAVLVVVFITCVMILGSFIYTIVWMGAEARRDTSQSLVIPAEEWRPAQFTG